MGSERTDSSGQTPTIRPSWRRYLARSGHPVARLARWARRAPNRVHLPLPMALVRPVVWVFLLLRGWYYFLFRVFVAEPVFKTYCTRYGKRLRTGTFIHWVQGKGDLILGDDVIVAGKCSFSFANRFADRPVLEIGDGSGIGHGCSFIVGKRIRIGKRSMLSGHIRVADSNGHPVDMEARVAFCPPSDDEVREVSIGDGVWIGVHSLIFPGVRIGDGAVVAAGSVVRTHVPPWTVVAGNPARVIFRLKASAAGDAVALETAESPEAPVNVCPLPEQ